MDEQAPHSEPTWASVTPSVQRKWARLTDADLEAIDGDPAELADRLRERYGYSTERARAEALEFLQHRSRRAPTHNKPNPQSAPSSDAEASFGLGRTGESRGREVPGDRSGHPGDSGETEARAARRG